MLFLLGLLVALGIVWAAAICDLRSFTIPHAYSYALMALWIPFAVVAVWQGVGASVLAVQALGGLIAFVIGVVLFAIGVMGGGDVKLLAALAPLLPFKSLPFFFVAVALCGLVWALAYGGVRYARLRAAGHASALSEARRSRLPYGPAIAAGLSLYSLAVFASA